MIEKLVGWSLVALLVFVILVVLAWISMFAWNLGVVAIVTACGGTVGKIGFWASFFANFAIGIVSRLLHPTK